MKKGACSAAGPSSIRIRISSLTAMCRRQAIATSPWGKGYSGTHDITTLWYPEAWKVSRISQNYWATSTSARTTNCSPSPARSAKTDMGSRARPCFRPTTRKKWPGSCITITTPVSTRYGGCFGLRRTISDFYLSVFAPGNSFFRAPGAKQALSAPGSTGRGMREPRGPRASSRSGAGRGRRGSRCSGRSAGNRRRRRGQAAKGAPPRVRGGARRL